MGSPCEINLYCDSKSAAEKQFSICIKEINRLESKYTRFKQDSVTTTINNAAGKNTTPIDEETYLLLNYADQLFQQSDQLFDITSGVLRTAWDFKSNTIPTQNQLDTILPLIGWDKIQLDEKTIRLPIEGMQIDFGGYVKEYTADVITTLCLDHGIQHGLVNLGGDIRIIGPHPDRSPWKVGIQHPRKLNQAIATVDMYEGAIATSGDYERFMMIDGKRYCHLLSPINGQCINNYYTSISVIGEKCLIAGSVSTIAMLKSEEDPSWIENLGIPHLCIDQELQLQGTIERQLSNEKYNK